MQENLPFLSPCLVTSVTAAKFLLPCNRTYSWAEHQRVKVMKAKILLSHMSSSPSCGASPERLTVNSCGKASMPTMPLPWLPWKFGKGIPQRFSKTWVWCKKIGGFPDANYRNPSQRQIRPRLEASSTPKKLQAFEFTAPPPPPSFCLTQR